MPRKAGKAKRIDSASSATLSEADVTQSDSPAPQLAVGSVSNRDGIEATPPVLTESLPGAGGSLPAVEEAVPPVGLAALGNGSHLAVASNEPHMGLMRGSDGSHLTGPISEGPIDRAGEDGDLPPIGSAVDLMPVGRVPSLRRVRGKATRSFYNRLRIAESIADNPLADDAARLRALDILGKYGPGMSEEKKQQAPVQVQVLAHQGAVVKVRVAGGKR